MTIHKTKWYLAQRNGDTRQVLLAHGAFKTQTAAGDVIYEPRQLKMRPGFEHCHSVRGSEILDNPDIYSVIQPETKWSKSSAEVAPPTAPARRRKGE